MSKVEERALEVYPKMSRISEHHGVISADYKSHYLGDANEEKREGFIEGYHQAEKDLELSWEDVEKIIKIHTDIYLDFFINDNVCKVDTKEYYQEVLKRFNEQRKEK